MERKKSGCKAPLRPPSQLQHAQDPSRAKLPSRKKKRKIKLEGLALKLKDSTLAFKVQRPRPKYQLLVCFCCRVRLTFLLTLKTSQNHVWFKRTRSDEKTHMALDQNLSYHEHSYTEKHLCASYFGVHQCVVSIHSHVS